MKIRIVLTLIAFIWSQGYDCRAEIRLPDVLGDNMVLQRDRPVPIWGKADPGEAVRVTFGTLNQSVITDAAGNWIVWIGPLTANATPESMIITGTNRIELSNILVGEVWLCSGQSNMQWMLEQSAGGEEAIKAANYPNIRLFNVSRDVAFKRSEGRLAVWQPCSPATVREFSGVGYFFGLELYRELGVPVGLINASYGGSQAEAWTPVEYLAASEDLRPCIEREKIWAAERPAVQAAFDQQIRDWEAATAAADSAGTKPPRRPRVPDALRDYRIAASIYNNMIEPLIPFGIRGALWYQGESNEERAEQYELLLPTMIRAWRERWGQGDFPFAIVQLPNFRRSSDSPVDEAWSHVRDAQRKTFMQMPNTGLIVTIDIGETADIHPVNKLDVGKRLFLWVMADVYGRKITKSGPVFREADFTGHEARLRFDEAGTGLAMCRGTALREFAIAGEDRKWHWANARIEGKDTVVVWSDEVPAPKAVRYAFNNNPLEPNLTNETCLPATPFRTDDWPGPTAGLR